MAIRLDEARLRLLKMCGELSPSINNTYNIGTSSLKFANVYATTFHGKLNGNANTATLLSLHNTMTSSSTRSVSASNWDGALSGVTYMWGQSFKDTSISLDTGDLVLAVRPSVYSSGNTELCMVIDGDYYSLTNKVLHAGNYNNYALSLSGGTMNANSVIKFTAQAGSIATSDPMAITYGRISAYGTLCINANTDNSGTEYVILTAGKGHSSSIDDGLAIGTSTLTWQNANILHASNYSSYALPLSGGTLTGRLAISYEHTGGGMLQLMSTDSNEASINYASGGTPYWVVGKGPGGTGNETFAWWYVPDNKNAMTLSSAGALAITTLGTTTINMGGNINFNNKGQCYIGNGSSDISPTVGGALSNLVFNSWWGISFTSQCSVPYQNKTAIGFDCRTSTIRANTLEGNATTATVAAALGRSGDTTGPMKFYWSGQAGQPSWLWGGNDGTNMYVYNPSNFSVNYANSAGCTTRWDVEASNPTTTNTDNSTGYFNKVGSHIYWYSTNNLLNGQPNTYGYILDIGNGPERHQIWMTQASGSLFHRGGNAGGWGSGWKTILDSDNYTSYTVTKTGSGASGTWNINISGNATTAQYPAGFSSYASGVTWGNTIGTSIACWNDPTGGSVDWRRDNPSSGKISMKVDGRVYVNEGFNPVMGMNTSGGFWGMGDPDGNSSDWIRTTTNGLIPAAPGGASTLGTDSWPFNTIWSKSQNIINTYWPSFNLISQTANSKGTYSKGMVEVNYSDSIGMWIHSNKTTDANSRRALVLYGYGQKADASEAIALRQCDTSGNWLSDLYLLHSGNYNNYALPLSGGIMSGRIGWSGASAVINSLTSSNYTQGMMIDVGMNGTGIYKGNGDNATTGTNGAANIIIKSWYGVGFATSCYNVTNPGISLNINTRTGDLNTIGKVYGAVWNDYAEYRSTEPIQPGRVVREDKDGIMKLTTERLMPACEIISDTFGFAIGETDECKTPIAATGRVLAYTYEDRYSFELGDAVCSGPNGTVSKMTRQELMMYPERMIGTVSEIPEYKIWGSGNVEVDGRIWIRVR